MVAGYCKSMDQSKELQNEYSSKHFDKQKDLRNSSLNELLEYLIQKKDRNLEWNFFTQGFFPSNLDLVLYNGEACGY